MLGETKDFKITLTYTLTVKASDKVAALDSALHQVNNNPCLYTETQVEEIEMPEFQKTSFNIMTKNEYKTLLSMANSNNMTMQREIEENLMKGE